MDQLPHSRPDAYTNNAMFADSQSQFNPYENILHSAGPDSNSYDGAWGVNPSGYSLPASRASAPSPSWASQNANRSLHGASHIGNVNGQPSPYARPVSQSPAPYGQHGYAGFNPSQNFQYQPGQPQYDPALFQSGHGQNFNYSAAGYQIPNAGTIAPQALQQQTRSPAFGDRTNFPSNQAPQRPNTFSNNVVDQRKLVSSIPAGADAGLFSIINFDDLAKATNTTRMGNYVNVGQDPMNWDCNRATLPAFVPRKSRNDLRKIAGNNSKLLAVIGKKSHKMHRIAAAPRTPQAAKLASAQPSEKIKYEGDSSSEEDSSSDDDDESSYTSDDEDEASPLPAKRPEGAKEGTEYDTIKALWRSKRKNVSSDSIRKGLVDFWEIAKTIRDRWKADASAYDEAKKKGQKSQLPLLEPRVKDQRDMIEVAFKAALKHGHWSIVEIMSENDSLTYLCYQFLLDRFKAEDYNSPLPRAMLELMTKWTSLTEERLEKTHVSKVLARYAKHGDAKTKHYANKITSNAAIASKEAKEKAASAQAKKNAAAGTKADSPTQRPAEPVAGVKRAATMAAGEGNAAKKVATGAIKQGGTTAMSRLNGATKKPSAATDAAKSTTATAPATKTKSVVAKPSGSIFSSLSAAKKPGTSNANKTATTGASTAAKLAEKKATTAAPKSTFSFAETMANLAKPKEEKPAQPKPEKQLPPETPEEKARRLRKESRRHLRVSFKRDDELTEVRYFTHDPDEELGHDASQMRDVSDVGGEGRMFKQQHQMMEIDEEDETPEDDETGLIEFREPGPIDFDDVDQDERARNYAQCGGGVMKVDSEERGARDYYEANNLIVFYTSPEDIPPDPREPSNPYTGDAMETIKNFAKPDDKWAARARQKAAQQIPPFGGQPQNTGAPQFDLSQLMGLMNQQPNLHQPPAHQQPQQQAGNGQLDVNSILARLAQAPQPQMSGFPQNFPPPPPQMSNMQPLPQPPANLDLAAILEQVGVQSNNAAQPPAMGGGFNYNQPYSTNNNAGWQGGAAGARNQRGDNHMSAEMRNDPKLNKKYKTKVCRFWQEGTCQKGDGCSYKHAE